MKPQSEFLGTTQQQAYIFVREQILSGAYAAGQKVNPNDVAKELGISRMPVREALRQLDSEGLVTIRPNRGAEVTALSAADVLEIFEIRSVLEGLAVRHALPLLTEDDLDELEYRQRRMNRVSEDVKSWIERHDDFHDYLCRRSQRDRLCGEIERFRRSVQPYLQMYFTHYATPEIDGFEHENLMEFVRARTAGQAEEFMRNHIMGAASGVIDFLRELEKARTAEGSTSGERAA